jgi:hypothetical protein
MCCAIGKLKDVGICLKLYKILYLLFCFSKKVTKKEPRNRSHPDFGKER